MKNIEQIEEEIKYGDVYEVEKFYSLVRDGIILPCDGDGYCHDGENELPISVWEVKTKEELFKYPYICWYNK